jgi:phosphatidylglycerophosphate synthase
LSAAKLQAAVRVPPEPLRVAGVPAVLRAARELADREGVDSITLCDAPEDFRKIWFEVLRRFPTRFVASCDLPRALSPAAPAAVLAGDGIPDAGAFFRFCADAAGLHRPTAWVWRGEPIAVYRPAGDPAGPHWPPDESVSRIEAPDSAWLPVRDVAEARAAERRLLAALGKASDGFLSRFDRRFSTALSRRLIATPVTPNQITWVSIAVGLLGAFAIASADYGICLLGTGLVWLSAILDGCDGEVARLKLLSSPGGAKLDLFGDHVVNFAVLAGIALHVHRVRPEGFGTAAILLAFGVLMSALTVARLLPPDGRRGGSVDLTLERIASRDFVYLVIPLAALGHLDWFFYAAAAGSNLFWLALWAVRWKRRFERPRREQPDFL